ncbi:hypothetical protein PRNP1_003728 [Phytophthora ramorum]
MKVFYYCLASLLFAVSLAKHVTPPMHAKHQKVIGGERALAGQGELDGVGDLGGGGNDDDTGDAGDTGDMAGLGGLGGGVGGYRALRGLDDELANGEADVNIDDEAVVAGGRVVSGGVVVTRPRRGPFY